MIIQMGDIVLNKTKRFLLPCLKNYGREFGDKISSVFKVAVGIGDIILKQSGISYEKHVFILVDTHRSNKHWLQFINYLKEQDEIYEDDYVYDSISKTTLHMIVIKLPVQCYKPAELLKKSQFSSMFSKKEIDDYFINNDVKNILVKDHNYRIVYTEKLNREWGTNIHPNELEGELEMPFRKEDEMFNSNINKK